MATKNSEQIRKDFPILSVKIAGSPLAYLDNGATTQKPQVVIDAISNYYQENNSNIHRSVHELATRATIQYEGARSVVAKFINCKNEEVIFTSGTTDALNKLAVSLTSSLQEGDEILLTEMEHHSNIVPWQRLAIRTNSKIKWWGIGDDFRLNISALNDLVSKDTKLVALTHVSNVLGTINPLKEIIAKLRKINPGIIVVVDAAQSVPHLQVDVQDLDCDFLAFSGHKTIGPTGIGVLYGKYARLLALDVNHTGGGMIEEVTKEDSSFTDIPYRFEAGTPNIAGAVGLAAAINYLSSIGSKEIETKMHRLTVYGLEKLQSLSGVTLLGPSSAKMRAPIFSFVVAGVHPHDVGEILNREGVAIRGGNHCAMPLFQKIGQNAASRASLYIYNDESEIDRLCAGILKVQKIFSVLGGESK